MDDRERQVIIEAKEKWLVAGNIGGAAACDFLLMNDRGLDIVYDAENELVKEYRELLIKRLETDSGRLVLMVNTEVERYFIDESEELHPYLRDEIYEHFQRGGKEYPIQAAWFHMDVISVLFYLDYNKKTERYIHMIQDTQRTIFGDESFLFCRNWCWIVSEVLCNIAPDKAMMEYDRNVDLFSKILKEEDILYQLCMNIAAIKVKWGQNADYLKRAVELCELWCRDIPIELRKQKQAIIRGMSAIHYRNIGELDMALQMFQEEMHLTEYIPYKLYLINQIAGLMLTKRDLNAFPKLLEEGNRLIAAIQETDEHVAGFYNACGLYCMAKGKYDEAEYQFDQAISIGEQVMGKEADDVVKFKSLKIMIRYGRGEMDKACKQMNDLYQIVGIDMTYYPQSFPLIFNSMVMMNLENNASSDHIKRIKDKLKINQNRYDLPSVLSVKCNLYYLMMASEDIYDRDSWEPLQKELEDFFYKNPNAEGELQYLKGEYYRFLKEKDMFSAGRVLDRAEEYYEKSSWPIYSLDYFAFYHTKLRNLFLKKDYRTAKMLLLSMKEKIIMPLFEILCHAKEDRSEGIFYILRSYVSLFISSAQQYPQLNIMAEKLYEFVLNMKYFEDLFYCRRQEFCATVERRRWMSVTDIHMSKEDFVIECYDYNRTDVRDIWSVFRVSEPDLRSLNYQIYFGIQFSSGIFSKRAVEVIGDIQFMKLREKIKDLYNAYDEREISEVEQTVWEKLQKFLDRKKRIFFCHGDFEILMPLAFIRISDAQYLGDIYQTIYCNTAKDVGSDVSVQDLSSSIFFGMSEFDGDTESQGIHQKLNDLPFAGLEVEALGELTGGTVYLDERKPKEWFDGKKAEIIHFATHTMKDEADGTRSLVIEKEDTGSYKVLREEDISKMNWKGIKLAVFAGCETSEEEWQESGKRSLSLAAKRAGTLFSISTWAEIDDGVGAFFMVCFYKNLLQYGKICEAFFETQKMVRRMTKREILADGDYINIGMDHYLQNMEEDSRPFDLRDDWVLYLLQMN